MVRDVEGESEEHRSETGDMRGGTPCRRTAHRVTQTGTKACVFMGLQGRYELCDGQNKDHTKNL